MCVCVCAAYRHTGGHPANALTLEEVHERENIAHTSRTPSSYHEAADQSAFNRLVAVLQSSGAIQDEPPQVCGTLCLSVSLVLCLYNLCENVYHTHTTHEHCMHMHNAHTQPQKLPRPPVPLAMPHRQQEHSLSGLYIHTVGKISFQRP